ncbi:helix-turn-helix transcriptional regulator [Acinetobacter sp. UBA6720]|uniref:helix-turn-helix transcriptional regulator n=1 Tax=Acinetobacter sp. UBA6720 TaxID=1945953 RepID=UPI0025C242B6|nr:WYL domain-containing protein [Acinetobacter sp. UBA6720]
MKRKASTHERLAERLANILTKLNTGYQLGVAELAHEFQVSTRTIERDFDRLNTYLPLLQDESTKKYFLDPLYLGRFKLQDIQNFAQLSGITELYPSLDMSFLRHLLDERSSQIFSAKGYCFENAREFSEHFQVFADAIHNRQKISFFYNDRWRHVDPYRLIHHQGSWYLAAAVGDELRAYRLSKIDQATLHENELFQHHPEVLMQLELSEGIWFGKHKQNVKISVRPEVALYFKQRLLLPEQQIILEDTTGSLLIACKICHEMQLLPLVRYWIPYIKIIEPAHFQQKLEQDLQHYLLPPL